MNTPRIKHQYNKLIIINSIKILKHLDDFALFKYIMCIFVEIL